MTAPVRPRTLLDRIGGPRSLSWPVVITAYVFTWLAFILDLPSPGMPEQAIRVVYLTIAQVVMIGVLRGARATVLRNTAAKSRPWLTMAVFALASTVITAVLGYLIKGRVVEPPAADSFGYASNTAATFVVLVIAAVAADAFAQHRHQQEVLSEDRMRLEHVSATVSQAIAERQQVTVTRISGQLTEAVSELTVDSPHEAVETLRWAAQDLVRPLSHDLATNSVPFSPTFPSTTPTGLNWPSVLRDATTGRPIPVIALPLISAALTVVYRIVKYDVTVGLLASAADAVAIWLGAVVANRILSAVDARLSPLARAVALTLALGVIGVIGVLTQRMLGLVQGTVGTLLLNVVITIFIGWALALLRATQYQLDVTEVELRKLRRELDWAIARANQTQWQQQRALARALHGPLQSAVNAAALRIDAAVRTGSVTTELVDSERASIIDALGYLPTAATDRIPDLELDFRRIQGTWDGLCDISITMPDAVLANIAADPACSSAVTDIVTESCANAIRHGHATRIAVSITQPESQRLVTLVIDNDGTPLDPASHTGLGMSLINDVALEWHLETTSGITRMSAILPTAVGPTRGIDREPDDA
ncbi:MAG: hypothetical protein IPO93_07830 [Actinobacteria bacterium]|nr:hypothetical protein [Actinomycetota bacterium]